MKELEDEISRRRWKSECLERFVMFLKDCTSIQIITRR